MEKLNKLPNELESGFPDSLRTVRNFYFQELRPITKDQADKMIQL